MDKKIVKIFFVLFFVSLIFFIYFHKFNEKKIELKFMKVKDVMTKNPIYIDKNSLAAKALSVMSAKKITSLFVYDQNKSQKTIGIIHIHNILKANIS